MSNKKSAKTTYQQFETMMSFFEMNTQMVNTALKPWYTASHRDLDWKRLTEILNADGLGPQKTVEKWKKTWKDYKHHVRAKAARISNHMSCTGSGPSDTERLTPLEERAVNTIGPESCNGTAGVPEIGVVLNKQPASSIDEVLQIGEYSEDEEDAEQQQCGKKQKTMKRKNLEVVQDPIQNLLNVQTKFIEELSQNVKTMAEAMEITAAGATLHAEANQRAAHAKEMTAGAMLRIATAMEQISNSFSNTD